MKYLKLYEVHNFQQNLQDFCNNYLAYLLDDGFEIQLDNRQKDQVIWFQKEAKEWKKENQFTWGEIKSYFIPFIHMLMKEYTLGEFYRTTKSEDFNVVVNLITHKGLKFNLDELLQPNFEHTIGTLGIGAIGIAVKNPKVLESSRSRTTPVELRYEMDRVVMSNDMIHRKKILLELSELYLAYLLDEDGYYVEVLDNSLRQNPKNNLIKDGFRIELAKKSLDSDSPGLTWIQWDDVKDRVIPLVYELSKSNSVIVYLGNVCIPLQSILDDDNVNELRLQDDFAQPEGFLILKLYIV